MARTVSDIVVAAPADRVMAVISDLAAYPQWATGVSEIEILERTPEGRALVARMTLDSPPIRDSFVLRYRWVSEHHVQWGLDDGSDSMLTAMDGAYLLEKVGNDNTRVTYQLSVGVAMPLLGMLKRKAEKVVVDTALKGLKKRVESDVDV
jgi:ribosome-associated toxin RatA of RatAB toxin-antitoxin module